MDTAMVTPAGPGIAISLNTTDILNQRARDAERRREFEKRKKEQEEKKAKEMKT